MHRHYYIVSTRLMAVRAGLGEMPGEQAVPIQLFDLDQNLRKNQGRKKASSGGLREHESWTFVRDVKTE